MNNEKKIKPAVFQLFMLYYYRHFNLTLKCLLLSLTSANMQEQLQHYDFSKFPSLKVKLIESVDRMLSTKISSLLNMIREEESKQPPQMVMGGAFEDSSDGPFGHGYGEGISAGADTEDWIVSRDKHRYDEIFYTLMPFNGKVTGINAKKEMMNSHLPSTVLGKIWKLADCDKDGMLDDEEFALAQYLIKVKLEGFELPTELPNHLVPPSHRKNPTADILYSHQEDWSSSYLHIYQPAAAQSGLWILKSYFIERDEALLVKPSFFSRHMWLSHAQD